MAETSTKKYKKMWDVTFHKVKTKLKPSREKNPEKPPEKIKKSLKETNKNKTSPKFWEGFRQSLASMSFGRMSVKEQTFFMKRLSFLIKAGIPVLESLVMIEEQTRKKSHSLMMKMVISDVQRGQYLSTSLSKFRKMFGDFSINLISFGESTGMLSDNLEYLAEELKKKDTLRKKVISAFIYPIIVTIATFGITGFLMVYLFPKITPVFSSLHITLPLTTRIVMAMSDFLIHYGLYLVLGIIIFIIAIVTAVKKSETFHFYFDKTILKIPVIGNIIQSYNLANSTRTLGLLLKSGITISESLEITGRISQNLVYKREFRALSGVVNRGERMSVYLATSKKLFPDILSQIVSVGERSGNLSHSLIYISEMYEAEVDDFTKNLSSLIEPVLMIVMGVMVGFIAISIITPIYSITQHLSPK